MPRAIGSRVFVVVAMAIGLWACNNGPAATTTPTPPTTTETFDGSINPNGAKTFLFNVVAAGTLTATLTTVGPDSGTVIGLAIGTWNGTTCHVVLANDTATQGAIITGSANAVGTLCARVYDVGNLTDVVTFTITVVHP